MTEPWTRRIVTEPCTHPLTTSHGPWAMRCLHCGAIGQRVGWGGARTEWPATPTTERNP